MIALGERPHIDAVSTPSISAPRYTSSDRIHAPCWSATRAMPSRSAAVNRAPVGLLGLQMTIIFVFGDTSRSSSPMSARHRPAA
ncbi:hypothetical protein D3C83_119730 [compost metagenome]